jgi:hypothetical protein
MDSIKYIILYYIILYYIIFFNYIIISLQSLTKMGKSLKQHTINPKAIPRTQLLGQIDLDTRQWTDGVLTLSALQVYSEPPGKTTSGLNIITEKLL